MPSEFRFSIPSLPIEIYHKFQELRKAHGLTQKQCLILGVYAICAIGDIDPHEPILSKTVSVNYLVAQVKEKYPSKKEGI